MMADKDIAGNMRILEDFATRLILTPLMHERAASVEELMKHVRKQESCICAASPAEAFALARADLPQSASPAPLIVIAGSFMLAGMLRSFAKIPQAFAEGADENQSSIIR
jgi:folylpolyglutamate synthase/dihydropteroate synthase